MSKIFITFEAETVDDLQDLVLNYALQSKKPPSWLGKPLDDEAVQAEAEAREQVAAEDAAEDAEKGNGADPEPEAPAPPKRARAARAPRVSAPTPAQDAEQDAEQIQQAAAKDAADRIARHNQILDEEKAKAEAKARADLPPLDTLKSVVTAAVRLAQKGEGSRAILDLLPGFKDTTGLAFVMNAEDKHRAALYDLVQAAGLPVV